VKSESLLSQKSSKKYSSTAEADIFKAHRLLTTKKSLTKTGSLGPKNHPRSPVLRPTLTSSVHIDYCWMRNRWWKLRPCCPKNNPRNPVLRLTLKSLEHIDYCWGRNRWWKMCHCWPRNLHGNLVLILCFEIFAFSNASFLNSSNSSNWSFLFLPTSFSLSLNYRMTQYARCSISTGRWQGFP
jgi:hypothetical protein